MNLPVPIQQDQFRRMHIRGYILMYARSLLPNRKAYTIAIGWWIRKCW